MNAAPSSDWGSLYAYRVLGLESQYTGDMINIVCNIMR